MLLMMGAPQAIQMQHYVSLDGPSLRSVTLSSRAEEARDRAPRNRRIKQGAGLGPTGFNRCRVNLRAAHAEHRAAKEPDTNLLPSWSL
jgi:hypothetical protein